MSALFSYNKVDKKIISLLRSAIGDRNVSSDEEKLISYSHDEVPSSAYEGEYRAEALVFPECSAHVSEIMKIASANRIPVTPQRGWDRAFGRCPSRIRRFGDVL